MTVTKEVTGVDGIIRDDAAQHLRDTWSKMEDRLDDVTTTWEAKCLGLTRDNEIMKTQLQVG